MLSRRRFLRTALLGAAFIPIALSPVRGLMETRAASYAGWGHASTGTITYDMLERAYQSCVIGTERPQMAYISAGRTRRLGLI